MRLDPACPEARELVQSFQRAEKLLSQGATASRLAHAVTEERDQAECLHLVKCERCKLFVRTCAKCKRDLALRGHTRTCPNRDRKWRILFGGEESPPLQHLAPAPAPRRVEAPRKRTVKPTKSAWAILGLPRGASRADVRRAYRERALAFHPDRVAHLAPEFRALAEKRMKEINAAYAVLSA